MATTSTTFLKPRDMLELSLGRYVIVRLKGGRYVRGILQSYDSHLNLHLANAEETGLNPQQQPKQLGRIVIRGDNVVFLVFPE